jgi:FkbM family methyltransferase
MQSEAVKSLVRAVIPREVRNWARSPRKSAGWLWRSARFRFGLIQELQISSECSLVCHPLAYKSAYMAQVCDPEQCEEFRQFLSHCHAGMLLFDIGASFGIFSLACAKLGGKAVAVEPSELAANMMATQLRLNSLVDAVDVIQAAAGETTGSIEMLSEGVFADGYYKVVSGRSKRETTRVDVTTVDDLSARFGTPSHLKIDVEGYEGAVLRGARQLLRKSSPLIFLELHNEMVAASGGDPTFALNELRTSGYEIFSTQSEAISDAQVLSYPICRILARRSSPSRSDLDEP